jgi:hypothetical protein
MNHKSIVNRPEKGYSRAMAKLTLQKWFAQGKPVDNQLVTGYRWGYIPNLRHREVMGFVTTHSLEPGIGISDLEAAIHP